ncbi:MAG TPA: glycoside hydrolase family 2 TIM barrel-domain containing protein [Edaphobacter sp.]|nr:glycoside hydrolase family 2 TIM barrel-domain containing protein [Edaphobacter sp.]
MIRKNDGAPIAVSRRNFIRGCAGTMALGMTLPEHLWGATLAQHKRGPLHWNLPLNQGWLFGVASDTSASSLKPIDLPHCVAPLSWHNWDPAQWQQLWSYRRSFDLPASDLSGHRAFLHFDGIMSGATPTINGTKLEANLGGFLPFEREVTGLLRKKNQLDILVDGRWLNVPPSGSPRGPQQVDYLMPGGIHRGVSLRIVPEIFLSDVFAKPVNVLAADRHMEINCTLDSRRDTPTEVRLEAVLFDGASPIARESKSVHLSGAGTTAAQLVISKLSNINLWSPETPKLYTLRVNLTGAHGLAHQYVTRVGFRDARFEVDGFFLNGKHTRLFGLNRHELFPYVGFAMPERVMRRDAEMLRHELNCNSVRCSHYPQTEAFLDACDELGLMVWEEVPGWQYLGDQAWRDLLLRDVKRMVIRDRNHPSIIVWGVRVNESHNDVPLYTRTKEIAKSLDDSRQTSGTMTSYSTQNWVQDVFAYDDYHSRPDGSVGMKEPLPGVPFFFSEGVGQFSYLQGKGFKQYYRRAGDRHLQSLQALFHAQGHDRAVDNPRCGGLIAWCAFEYASLVNGVNTIKHPGVVDTFRIPKLGATFYHAQVSPSVRPVIEPSFYWDFSPAANGGPGKDSVIFSNCDRLVIRIGNKPAVTLHPDKAGYPNLKFPPFFADLTTDGSDHPELRIDGYVGERLALTRRFSSDRSQDVLALHADDHQITGDGSDATRVWFAVCDKYGTLYPHLEGEVTLHVEGPAERIGDASLSLAETGGVGAIWLRSKAQQHGTVTVSASHPRFGKKSVAIQVLAKKAT